MFLNLVASINFLLTFVQVALMRAQALRVPARTADLGSHFLATFPSPSVRIPYSCVELAK